MSPADLATPTAALLFGLFGSGHCLAMCGGISGALALRAGHPAHTLLHHTGRVLGYAAAGALAGMLGLGVSSALDAPRAELAMRIAAGAVLLLVGVRLALRLPDAGALQRFGAWWWSRTLAPLAARLGRSEGTLAALGVGVLWGWLPCAMSWTALLAAAVAGDPARGALTMLAFGAGTLPLMLGGALLALPARTALATPSARRMAGALLIAIGVWTIWVAMPGSAPVHHHHMQ